MVFHIITACLWIRVVLIYHIVRPLFIASSTYVSLYHLLTHSQFVFGTASNLHNKLLDFSCSVDRNRKMCFDQK